MSHPIEAQATDVRGEDAANAFLIERPEGDQLEQLQTFGICDSHDLRTE